LQKKYKQALSYHDKNLDLLRKEPNKQRLAETYNDIGVCYLDMRQEQLALEYFEKALQLKQKIGNKKLLLSTLSNIAKVYYRLKDYAKADLS
jgi:tetratricopeptide (TPR) repeat protein